MQPDASTGDATPRSSVQTDYVRTVITLKDDEGTGVPAILTHPKSGVNPYAPAIVLHHGGPGGNPVNYSGAPRFFAEGAAAAGYSVVSILSRHSRFYPNTPFGDASKDIKAAVDFLDDYGVENIVLGGHSLGGIRTTRYLAETNDARVKALIQYAPTRDMPEWVRSGMGDTDYNALISSAEKLVGAGRGKERITFRFVPKSPPWPEGVPVSFSHTAETFLDWWGPNAKTYHTKLIGEVEKPILLLAGDKDAFVYPAYMDEMKAAATSSPRVDAITYPNVGHIFAENRPEVIADSLAWLDEIGLGPRPAIAIDLVDAKTETGRTLSGVKYAPLGGEDKSKPVFLLLHGWSGDVMWSSNHWLGVRLAQAGYTAIGMRLRVSGRRGVTTQTLATVTEDIGAWTKFAESNGYDAIVGEGHSAGGIWWTTYINASQNETLKGIVYLAPTRNMAASLQHWIGDEAYADLVAVAEKAVADGKAKETMISNDLLPEDKKRAFPFFQYADAFLSYWGPNAKSVHTDEVAKFDMPTLSIVGSADGLFFDDFLDQFVKAAGPKAQSRFYDDGAPHSLKGWEDRTAQDVIEWTRAEIEK